MTGYQAIVAKISDYVHNHLGKNYDTARHQALAFPTSTFYSVLPRS